MRLRPWLAAALLLAPAAASAAPLAPAAGVQALVFDTAVRFDINELSVAIPNFGPIARDYRPEQIGLEWPQGSGQRLIHGAGLWLVSYARQDVPRSAMADFGSEFTPGIMDGAGNATDPYGDDASNYVHKISRTDLSDPGHDWLTWPINEGAPLDSIGHPRLIGDQTLYNTFNDAFQGAHHNLDGSSPRLQAEVHQTVFGSNRQLSLARVMYVHYEIKNRSSFRWPEFYVGMWADPDIGDPYDDLAGADSALKAAYAYDSAPSVAGSPPPAVGVCVLLDSLRNRPVPPVHAISSWTSETDPESYEQALNLARGYTKSGENWMCGPDTTKFLYDGDPFSGTGCLDPVPGDKRLLVSTGPFDVNPGALIDVVIAYVVGSRAGATSVAENVQALREGFAAAREGWVNLFSDALPVPASPALSPASPNPFRGATGFQFALPVGVMASEIQVLDMRGRLLWKEPALMPHDGYYQVYWDGQTLAGTSAPTGVYFFRLITDHGPFTQKAVRLR
ncbi:MAG TPA: hypothetical protein VGR66_03150 [Candidatus Eisenbacteria bacterium]|jgi:hypothetical protein|nr:hypothetical protein [Candidatus Eisenbacteria bacterium]